MVAPQPVAEGFAFDERHDIEQVTPGGAGIEDRQDVRMLQGSGELDLPEKPLGPHSGREFGFEHLDRDPSAMAKVLSTVHDRHAALAELLLDHIAILQTLPQILE